MDRRRRKFVLLGAGVVICMGFLLAVGIGRPGSFVYYLTVSEFLSQPRQGTSFRINGKVEHGSVQREAGGLDLRFRVTDGTRAIPVSYHGIVPDTFVEGADVVIEGGMGADGTFAARSLLAKCPSKYKAKEAAGETNPHLQAAAPTP